MDKPNKKLNTLKAVADLTVILDKIRKQNPKCDNTTAVDDDEISLTMLVMLAFEELNTIIENL